MTAETNRRLKLAIRVLDATFASRTPRADDLLALYELAESGERDSQADELACIVVHRELKRSRAFFSERLNKRNPRELALGVKST